AAFTSRQARRRSFPDARGSPFVAAAPCAAFRGTTSAPPRGVCRKSSCHACRWPRILRRLPSSAIHLGNPRMNVLPRRTALAIAFSIALGSAGALAADLVPAALPSPGAIDAARGDANLLILRAGVFDPRSQRLDLQAIGAAAPAPTGYAIVQFEPGRLE